MKVGDSKIVISFETHAELIAWKSIKDNIKELEKKYPRKYYTLTSQLSGKGGTIRIHKDTEEPKKEKSKIILDN